VDVDVEEAGSFWASEPPIAGGGTAPRSLSSLTILWSLTIRLSNMPRNFFALIIKK
jgi:hypothetical protein